MPTMTIPEEITLSQRILPLGAALIIALLTIELIRRRKLREEYAMLWITASAGLLVFALFPRLIWHVSKALGLFYLTTVNLLGFAFVSLVLLHLAVVISRSADDKRKIAQRVALLEQQLDELRRGPQASNPADWPPDDPSTE
jgi:hypothetical protein